MNNNKLDQTVSFLHMGWDEFYGAARLTAVAEHMASIGERPEYADGQNHGLFRAIESVGNLLVTAATSNGRVLGYVVTMLWPSLEAPDRPSATHTWFYASPDFPGLGRRILDYAETTLRDRGIKEVFYRAGVRGSGPRLGAMYLRRGGKFDGTTYRRFLS